MRADRPAGLYRYRPVVYIPAMESAGNVVLVLLLLAVLGALGLGIVAMLRGGEFNRRHGNRLMRLRVGLQGAAIVLLALMFFVER